MNHPGWMGTDGIFFSVPELTKVISRLTLLFPFLSPDLRFCFGTFFSPHLPCSFFFLPPPPTHIFSRLPIPLTPTHQLTNTFKFKIDSLPHTYSPTYLKCDTFLPTYFIPPPIYLHTYPPIYVLAYPSIFLYTSPLGRYLLDPTYLVTLTYNYHSNRPHNY